MPKLAVIGLDCVPPSLVFDRWRKDLPNFDSLISQGLWGPLESCHPPITVPAWSSMLSGLDPGQLGLYGFRNQQDRHYDSYRIADSRSIRRDRVWDILSRSGRRCLVLGVPQTFPAMEINGWMLSCFLSPTGSPLVTYPSELWAEIGGIVDDYVFDVEDYRSDDPVGLLSRIYDKTEKHFRVATTLLQRKPWDFFMMVEMGPDRIHHAFWKYFDAQHPRYEAGNPFETAVYDYYCALDKHLGRLLRVLPPDCRVVVVSDHGAKAMQGGICLNQWLMEEGYLVLHRVPDTVTVLKPSMIDWSKTQAWADGGYCGRVFLNLCDREPQGIVPVEDRVLLIEELIRGLKAIPGCDGRTLRTEVRRPESVYREIAGIAPDLLIYFGNLDWRAIGSVGHRRIQIEENDTGPDGANHDWHGIYIAKDGESDLGGRRLEGLQITDVAPTLLSYMGEIPPDGLKGRIIDRRWSS